MEELLSFLATPVISSNRDHYGIVGVNGKLYISNTVTVIEHPLQWPVTSVSHTAEATAVITCEGTVYVGGCVVTKYPDVEDATYPDWTVVPFSEPVVSVQIGYCSMTILTLSGKVYGIGCNGDGHLAIDHPFDRMDHDGVNEFTLIELPAPCLQVKVRSTSTCAVTVDGSLYAWGHNTIGKVS